MHVNQCSYGTEHNTVTSNTPIGLPVRYNATVAVQCYTMYNTCSK